MSAPRLLLPSLVLLLGAISCAHTTLHAPAPPPRSVAPPVETTPALVPSSSDAQRSIPSPCESAREVATRVLLPAAAEDPSFTPFNPERPITGRCLPAKGGTWALVLTSLTVHTDEDSGRGLSGTFELFHTDAKGKLATVAPQPLKGFETNFRNVTSDTSMALHEPILFDFDGDGSDEFIVYGDGGFHEGESFAFGAVWTFRDGAIVPYKGAANIPFVDVKDVTGDGRPDLLFHGAFDSVVESSCSGFGFRITGPLFVAHAREDGTFATNDAAADLSIRKQCPKPPGSIVMMRADDPNRIDEERTFNNVACARVWGMPTARLKDSIVRGCRNAKVRLECDEKRGECTQQAEMLEWATRKPPLSLPRPPG